MASSSYSSSVSGISGISALAEQYMQQQYAWGQDQFAKNSQLTDQVVGNLMGLYENLSGIGQTMMSQYQSMFMPEYQNLVNDANSYSSQARIQQAMGAAESGVAQAFNGQRNAALADLQSYGIDPSSGRYAQLDAAERTQQAAAQAGAGFQAEQATEATGRGLRSEALQLGSVMPSQATGAYNAAAGAANAAENVKLANSQEGVNMMGSPTQWGALGQQYKTSGSVSSSSDPQKSSPQKSNSNSNPSSSSGRTTSDTSQEDQQGNTAAMGLDKGTVGGGQPSPEILSTGGGSQGNTDPNATPMDQQQTDQMWGTDPNATPMDQQQTDQMWGTDPNAGASSADTSGGDTSTPSYDDSGYEGGGAIPISKSPSRGNKVDDVRAKVNQTGDNIRVNAGEFIVPRKTVAWKGEKYFRDLVKKTPGYNSKIGPTMKPALNMRGGYHG